LPNKYVTVFYYKSVYLKFKLVSRDKTLQNIGMALLSFHWLKPYYGVFCISYSFYYALQTPFMRFISRANWN